MLKFVVTNQFVNVNCYHYMLSLELYVIPVSTLIAYNTKDFRYFYVIIFNF